MAANLTDGQVLQTALPGQTLKVPPTFKARNDKTTWSGLSPIQHASLFAPRHYQILLTRRMKTVPINAQQVSCMHATPQVQKTDAGVKIVGGNGVVANVIYPDVTACNAIIHVIDAVLGTAVAARPVTAALAPVAAAMPPMPVTGGRH